MDAYVSEVMPSFQPTLGAVLDKYLHVADELSNFPEHMRGALLDQLHNTSKHARAEIGAKLAV